MRSQRVRLVDWASNPETGFWVVEATVVDKDGNIHSALGDASPANVGSMIANATLRMAATRAVNRCLRRVLHGPGVALTSAEELPGAPDSSDPDLGIKTEEQKRAGQLADFEREAGMLGFTTPAKIQAYSDGAGPPSGFACYGEMDRPALSALLRSMKEEHHG